jgi:AcrR family transcriptional regulator
MPAKDRKSTQRERLLAGMIAAANRDGYAHANVSQVIANAGVSRPTFYDYFTDKDDCFLVAHQEIAQRLLERVRIAVKGGAPEHAAQTGARALIDFASSDPNEARFLLHETMAAGPRALDQRDAIIGEIERVIERAKAKTPTGTPTPDLPTRVVLGAVYWMLGPLLRRGERDLEELSGDLELWIESYNRPWGEHRWHILSPGPPIPGSPHVAELAPEAPPPLPLGRPRASPSEVARNQRERILYATAEVAVGKGYTATRIADITAAAGVDGRVFYTHFRDKQQAFLAVHELGIQQVMATTASAFFNGATWPDRVWEGVRASSHFNATYPIISHVGFVESNAVGSAAIQRIEDSRIAFTIFLQEGYQYSGRSPRRTVLEAIGAATFEIGYRQMRTGNGGDMQRMACHVVYLCLAPFLGPEAATEFIDGKLQEIDQASALDVTA